jgi:DNA-binding transcriptional ArsR family regulator
MPDKGISFNYMVEQIYDLDSIFSSLGDPTRRDILSRINSGGMSVGAIARNYAISLAGVAKHLDVLERAGLVRKTRHGREQIVAVNPAALAAATDYLETYRRLWEQRLDSLDVYLQSVDINVTKQGE